MVGEAEVVTLRPDKIPGTPCAWNGCGATWGRDRAQGWVYLETFTAGEEPVGGRDCILCPEHARSLEALLKVLLRYERALDLPPAGIA